MAFWETIKRGMEWLEHVRTLVQILLALGLGDALKVLLATHIPSMPNIWLTPIWLISSGLLLASMAWMVPKLARTRQRCDLTKWQLTEQKTVYGHLYLNEKVEIDGKIFDHCRFSNVTLVSHGLGPVEFKESHFNGDLGLLTDNMANKAFILLVTVLQRQLAQSGKQLRLMGMDEHGNLVPLQ